MRFSTLFPAFVVLATGATGVSAVGSGGTGVPAANFSADSITTAASLTPQNFYGAPIPPVGDKPPSRMLFCHLLELIHFGYHCPQPPHNPPPYTKTYGNLNCASHDGSYQTYGFVDVVADCQAMCDSVSGCISFNTYHDVYGQGPIAQLTCTLYKVPLTVGSASYCGGEHQPDGSTHHIINSDGYCKKTPTP
ncbi:hypothetical protein B0H19DRAFT_1077153 [Mycena capillaripes]|nr:hypothetical protein B0H19DRAFT_1077153 [Mycena capillaripes]